VVRELRRRGWTNKRWTTRDGQVRGNQPFNKTSLHHLLTRVVYLGKLPHKQEVHDGEHPAIVDDAVWQSVQELLHRRHSDARPRQRGAALLGGLVFCTACGKAMAPSYASKKGRQRHRYYICTNAQKNGHATCPAPSLPGSALERFVVGQIQDLVNDPDRLLNLARVAANAEPTPIPRPTDPADAKPQDDHEEVSLEVIRQPGWDHLPATVQAEVLHRLVRRIAYDGAAGKVLITFQPHGIQALALAEEQP
jgi:site-specific DNA recombinase